MIEVTIATATTALPFVVPFLGRALGYWREEGLDVEWVVAGGGVKALAAVVSGRADFSLNAFSPEVIKAIDAGQKIKAVAVTWQRGAQILVLNKEISKQRGVSQKSSLVERAKALEGLTIAVSSAGGGSPLPLKALVAEAGLDIERDMTVTYIGNDAALLAAMRQKQIDGFFTSVPAPVQSVMAGDAIMLVSVPDGEMPMMGNLAHAGLVTQASTMTGKADIVDAALRALWRSHRFFNQDPIASAKALRTLEFYADIDERAFNTSIEALLNAVPKEPIITEGQFNDMVRFHNYVAQEEDRTKITVEQFFDEGPALRAKEQLGL